MKQGGVSQSVAFAIYIKKMYLKKAKEEELWKLKYNFTMPKLYNLQKKKKSSKKQTKIFEDIIITL